LEVSVNRNDFGGRRLQFRTPCRRIHGESLRANGHDQPVSCGEKWIVFFRTQQYWSLVDIPLTQQPTTYRLSRWKIMRVP
jgi:hypothetical protein